MTLECCIWNTKLTYRGLLFEDVFKYLSICFHCLYLYFSLYYLSAFSTLSQNFNQNDAQSILERIYLGNFGQRVIPDNVFYYHSFDYKFAQIFKIGKNTIRKYITFFLQLQGMYDSWGNPNVKPVQNYPDFP